jgi:hypothetical protein
LLFWDVMQSRLVATDVSEKTYRSHLQRSSIPRSREFVLGWSNMKNLEVVLREVPRFQAREGTNMWSQTVSCILHVT